jgi:hypothetical protein
MRAGVAIFETRIQRCSFNFTEDTPNQKDLRAQHPRGMRPMGAAGRSRLFLFSSRTSVLCLPGAMRLCTALSMRGTAVPSQVLRFVALPGTDRQRACLPSSSTPQLRQQKVSMHMSADHASHMLGPMAPWPWMQNLVRRLRPEQLLLARVPAAVVQTFLWFFRSTLEMRSVPKPGVGVAGRQDAGLRLHKVTDWE